MFATLANRNNAGGGGGGGAGGEAAEGVRRNAGAAAVAAAAGAAGAAEWNQEEIDHYSFDDSDRFEEDSLCSWSSEPESLCNNWRGWKKPFALAITNGLSTNGASTSVGNPNRKTLENGKLYFLSDN